MHTLFGEVEGAPPTAKPLMRSPIKRFGGKGMLAPRLIPLLPPKPWTVYVEPYFGGGSILFGLRPGEHSEIANDLDDSLVRFWRCLRDCAIDGRNRLIERLSATPYSRSEFRRAKVVMADAKAHDDETVACAVFATIRQSFAAMGDSWAAPRKDRPGGSAQTAWWNAIDGLDAAAERLRHVAIESCDALKLIDRYDREGVVFYLDPPYLHCDEDGRKVRQSCDEYDCEMTIDDHRKLLDALLGIRSAKAMLSGYPSELYDGALAKWDRTEIHCANHAAGPKAGGVKRVMIEVVWRNYT